MQYKNIELKNKNNLTIRGVENLPDKYDGVKKLPTIIIVHGHTGNKMGNAFFYVRMSKYFTSKGYATFRFDFTGSGESDGEFENMTLTSEIKDMDCIMDYVENCENVDTDNIFIIGHSMGGLITTLKAYEYKPKKIILLAPANDMYNSVVELYRNYGENMEEIEYLGLKIKKEFMLDMEKYKPYEKAALYKGDVLIFRGSEDTAVTKETCIKTERNFPGVVEYYELEGIDHSFVNYDIRQYIIKKICNFIEQE
ncbi:alpha/beta hydrolase family protein [Miniphocaeibacter halophilus]|uniref:Alpha/beta fold hydrolase n=1 Tax=Miniphocaeibacter halophilus TaxID=2931922 RepID=A0AC61MS07_9FIRM|nr:alpha/beta fold hydrolase [Miniphocaeibacter halophilus]QQK08362.1 alpha/beta fold hydrolase [Miniphocaeibacter halophilus]